MIKKLLLTPSLILTVFNLLAVDYVKDGIAYKLRYGTGSYLEVVENPDGSQYSGKITIPSYPNVLDNSTGKGSWPVSVINGSAFAGCGDLTSITLPETLNAIWTAYVTPDYESTYEWGGFGGCRKLTSIKLTESITSIEPYTFADCTSLKSLSIPASVRYSNYASIAPGCTSMTSITVNSKNKDLYAKDGILYYYIPAEDIYSSEEHCLITCPAGKSSASVAAGTTGIGVHAFAGCSKLTKISIPGTCTFIASYAFEGCSRLKDVECMATTPPNIDVNTFDDATLKGTLTVPENSLEAYKAHAIWGKFKTIKGVATTFTSGGIVYDILNHTYRYAYVAYNKTNTGKVSIPKTVTTNGIEYTVVGIVSGAFSTTASAVNEEVTSVSIPSTVYAVINDAFYDCPKLTAISVDAANEYYSAQDGILYDKEKAKLLVCPRGKTGTVALPSGVTMISEQSFEGCKGISSVSFPSTVTTVGESAFAGCHGLTAIDLGDGLKEVGSNAFADCALTELTLPASLETVNYYSFHMPSLQNVTSLRLGAPFSNADLVFSPETYEGGILFVEPGYEKGYDTARGFSNFKRILAIGTSGIDTEAISSPSINSCGGTIIVDGAAPGAKIEVRSTAGVLAAHGISDGNQLSFAGLAPGIYVVTTPNLAVKLIVD